MGELKPCPFCGAQPEYVRSERDFATLDEALLADCDVKCRTPKCPIRFMPTAFTLAEWNTRPNLMGEEMVERVARAIELKRVGRDYSNQSLARAALNAISEGVGGE